MKHWKIHVQIHHQFHFIMGTNWVHDSNGINEKFISWSLFSVFTVSAVEIVKDTAITLTSFRQVSLPYFVDVNSWKKVLYD